MKVLHVIPSLSTVHGGPTKALGLMERVLTAQGLAVETVTTDDDGPYRHNNKTCGLPLQENGVTRRYFRKRVEFYKVAPGLAVWAARHVRQYDLVHIHALFSFTSIAVAWAARRAGVPYILRPLGTLTRYGVTQRRPWLKQLSLALFEGPALRHAAVVHFTSEEEAREALQWGMPMRSVVIPLGIESAQRADANLARGRFASLGEDPYLLYLSRLDPKKNVEGLLRALSLCSAGLPQLRLVIAGDGDAAYVAGLKALAHELKLSDRVVWAGHVDGAVKASLLASAAVFVLPSFSENFGIAAAEALMAGKPCILGKGVAIAQDVADAGAGLAVAPDAESIAAGVAHLMTDTKARASMCIRAAELAHEKYSASAMGSKLVRLYSEILN